MIPHSGLLKVATKGERELVLTRIFDAPRPLVFEAFTKPALVRRWLGGLPGWRMSVCEIDLRVGGAWKFVSTRPDGREIGQFGVYREIETNARLVQTENWTDWNPGELMVSTIFAPIGEATRLEVTMRFPSRDVRDLLIKSGMNDEAAGQYRRLDAVLGDYQTR